MIATFHSGFQALHCKMSQTYTARQSIALQAWNADSLKTTVM